MKRILAAAVAALFMAGAAGNSAGADDRAEAQEIVTESQVTLSRILRDEQAGPKVRQLMKRAKGVMVFPEIIKGAFFIGGEGGSGVLMSRYANGAWSYPAFYTMGSVSIGFQIGGQSSEAVLLVMTDGGMQAILDNQVKLGADLSAAAGPVGSGVEASSTTAAGADIYVYSLNKGLFVGVALEGAVIGKRSDWNQAYYGQSVSPRQIVLENRAQNPAADPLRGAVEGIR